MPMKLPLLALLFALVLPFASGAAQEKREKQKEHDTELGRQMEKLEDLVRPLRKSLRAEGASAEALATLAEIERITLTCKELAPEAAAKLPEAERSAFVTAYRRTMVDFLTRQLELEAAILDGDAAATQTALERFRAMEDSSHERFAPEDK